MKHWSRLFAMAGLLIAPLVGYGADPGFYLGAGVGSASFKDDLEIDSIDDSDVGFKLFAGYQMAPYLAVEGGYRDFGKAETGQGSSRVEIATKGWDIYGLAMAPFGLVDLFAKAGVVFWDTDSTAAGITIGDDGSDFAWGVGGHLNFGRFGLRLEYESFELDRPNELWMVSLSGVFRFGRP